MLEASNADMVAFNWDFVLDADVEPLTLYRVADARLAGPAYGSLMFRAALVQTVAEYVEGVLQFKDVEAPHVRDEDYSVDFNYPNISVLENAHFIVAARELG